jgi:hypothetical protein
MLVVSRCSFVFGDRRLWRNRDKLYKEETTANDGYSGKQLLKQERGRTTMTETESAHLNVGED